MTNQVRFGSWLGGVAVKLGAVACVVALCGSGLTAHAATVTWDAGGGGGAITNGAGAWLAAGFWNNAGAAATWTSGDDGIFAGPATAGGAVTLASPTTANTLTFNPSFTGTYTLGTAGQALTINNGITKNAGSGTVTFASSITLGGAQTWANNSGTINFNSTVAMNGNLTIDGSGTTVINNSAAIFSGTGDLIKNGSGNLNHGGASPVHTFTGNVIVNGGNISSQSNAWLTGRNVLLTNGYIGGRFGSGFTWTSGLGTGANQIQITGGTSGFSGEGNTGSTFQIGTALSTLKWGAAGENGATGFFNPTVFLANGTANMNTNGKGSLNNGIDLNGTTRTITSTQTTDGQATSGFTISGVVSNSTGTAGITKTGVGNLILANAGNSFNGHLTINGGTLTFNNTGAWGGAGKNVTFTGTGGVRSVADGYSGGIVTVDPGVTGSILVGGAVTYNSVTGAGNLIVNTSANKIVNINDASGLTGNLQARLTGNANYNTNTTIQFNSLSDTVGSKLQFVGGTTDSNQALNVVLSGGSAPLVFDNRQVQMLPRLASNNSPRYSGISNNNASSANTWIINTNLDWGYTSATPRTNGEFRLGGTNTGDNAFNGVLSQGSSLDLLNLSKVGNGKWIIGNVANTYTGQTIISAGTLEVQGSIATSSSISNSASLIFNSALAQSYGNAINGTGTLTKNGLGTLTLSGTNGYTGATTVNAGTLTISAGNINGTSAINVAAGASLVYNSSTALTVAPALNGSGSNRATLSGTGTISAALSLTSLDDVLSPGNSPGIMPFGVDQPWNSYTYEWEVNDWTASVAGTNFDQIQITGSLDLTGGFGSYALDVTSLDALNDPGDVPNFAETNKTWTILTTTTGITGFNAANWTINTAGFSSSPVAAGTWNVAQSGNNLILNYVAVPEPAAIALAAFGLIGLGVAAHRRFRRKA